MMSRISLPSTKGFYQNEKAAAQKFLHGGFQIYHLQLESCSQSIGLSLVAWLAEEGEHVLLVGLDARLVERIDAEHVAADTAGLLEEIEEGSEVVFVDALDAE